MNKLIFPSCVVGRRDSEENRNNPAVFVSAVQTIKPLVYIQEPPDSNLWQVCISCFLYVSI